MLKEEQGERRHQARPHHYAFAHVALRDAFFQDPQAFVVALTHRGTELLNEIWDDVGDRVGAVEGAAARLPSQGLACSIRSLDDDTLAAIVSLPTPEAPAEAHLVGLVLRLPSKKLWGLFGKRGKGLARCLTLERGSDEGSVRTVLCEWTTDSHLNYDTGPEATVDAFARKLAELMNR
ncbi:MAG: hypothetical protein EPO68_16680 [Planctomycetota bacterium]|nr:MAG: hypothetical protein EPO68_16680 [Planctomycetota bacterium]